MDHLRKIIDQNREKLKQNRYPGRGIIQGITKKEDKLIQIYWIMGRSENSRNRIFVEENGFVKTAPFDPAKMKDPSLIIYYPIRFHGKKHIVSNGDQTDTVWSGMQQGKTFETTLETRKFEPDAPNYTPRITGLIDLEDPLYLFRFSVIRATFHSPDFCERLSFNYEKGLGGVGFCVHTYDQDGDILPSFSQYPYYVPIYDTAEQNLAEYWECLYEENRISLLVKEIDRTTGETIIKIKNQHKV